VHQPIVLRFSAQPKADCNGCRGWVSPRPRIGLLQSVFDSRLANPAAILSTPLSNLNEGEHHVSARSLQDIVFPHHLLERRHFLAERFQNRPAARMRFAELKPPKGPLLGVPFAEVIWLRNAQARSTRRRLVQRVGRQLLRTAEGRPKRV
jgi:hypothetical protein